MQLSPSVREVNDEPANVTDNLLKAYRWKFLSDYSSLFPVWLKISTKWGCLIYYSQMLTILSYKGNYFSIYSKF